MKRLIFVVLSFGFAFAVSCFSSDAPSCTVSCTIDGDCPSSLKCSPDGMCNVDGAACTATSCTPGMFVSCTDASTLQQCNATGDGYDTQDCGASGCSTTAGACNSCVAGTQQCDGAGSNVEQCNSDGNGFANIAACTLGCVGATGTTAVHCGHLDPIYLSGICDTPATLADIDFNSSTSIDSTNQVTCNGGILPQTGGSSICVVRGGTIEFSALVTAAGANLLAFVADGDLHIATGGYLSVSAVGTTSGPGGGAITSGGEAGGTTGGGGAGFLTAGGVGGGTGGGAAGPALDPTTKTVMIGGPKSKGPNIPLQATNPGGGGGGLILVSCTGSVTIDGEIGDHGGGGAGGFDKLAGGGEQFLSGAGGGAGGYVVIQGAQVLVNGGAQLYANGGGGGGDNLMNDAAGMAGQDGVDNQILDALGGTSNGGTGSGGNGGYSGAENPPTAGQADGSTNAGGGGGSQGRFQFYTPMGVLPTFAFGALSSPGPDPNRTVPTK